MSSAEFGQVINLQDYLKTTSTPSLTIAQDIPGNTVARGMTAKTEIGRSEWRPVSELYPGLEDSSLLQHAQRVMEEVLGVCQRALECLTEDHVLEADLEIMRLSPLAIELFCCRELSEGLANTADALLTGIRALAGSLMERTQVLAVRECISRLYDSPGISFDDSLSVIAILDDAGFSTNLDFSGLAGDE